MTTIWLVLLGGGLSLDAVAVGQFMLSRPFVGAWLSGWLVGDALAGALAGALLELYLLAAVPSGAARVPEPGPGAVIAGAAAAWPSIGAVGSTPAALRPGALVLSMALALVFGWLGGRTQLWQRHWVGRRLPVVERAPDRAADPATAVSRAHLGALVIDFARGAALTLTGVLLVRWLVPLYAPQWPLSAAATWGVLLPGALVSLGVAGRGMQGATRWPYLAAGLLLGWLLGQWIHAGGSGA